MANYRFFVGWDVSQDTLNFCIRDQQAALLTEGCIVNQPPAIRQWCRQLPALLSCAPREVFFLVEHTGLYSHRLVSLAHRAGLSVCLEDALRINKAATRRTDKTDAKDARLISLYGYERAYRLKLWAPERKVLRQLEGLQRRRRNLIKNRQSLATSLNNSLALDKEPLDKAVVRAIRQTIAKLDKVITLVEAKVVQLIEADGELLPIYRRVRSCFGFGPKNTVVVLLETGFLQKIPTAKACANYAGLRPNEHRSGTSIHRRARTSKKVNLSLKTAFHQAAFSAMINSPVHRAYYQRKRQEGKTHLQVLNALRNKLCRTIYACVKKEEDYQKNYTSALVKS